MALVGVEGTGCYLDRMGMGHPHPTIKDYVEGSCMMGRTDIVRENGPLFDPEYRFAYCEDADLSLRLRKKGYEIAHVPLNMKHVRGKTSDSVREDIDIDGFHVFNHMVLMKRWHKYLKTKSFTEEIAIQRSMAMGDVLWVTPVLRQMKRENPYLKISFYTQYPEILRGNPNVDTVGPCTDDFYFIPENNRINLDLCYEKKPYQHTVLSYAEACGVKLDPKDWFPEIFINEDENEFALDITKGRKWAAVHTGPNDTVGRTLTSDLIGSVEAYLSQHGYAVYRISPEHGHTFHQMTAIIGECELFVGADSLPMHLAQMQGVSTVGIYGAISPLNWQIPNLPWVKAVTAKPLRVGCLGCSREYAPPRTGPLCIRTGENYNLCMARIEPQDVFDAIEEVLRTR